MTKSEQREIVKIAYMHSVGMTDTVARSLSALIRAARTSRSRAALTEYAAVFNVSSHPEFVI